MWKKRLLPCDIMGPGWDPSIHIHIYIKVLSVSHSLGLAPGYVEQQLSMHFCLAINASQATIIFTIRPKFRRIVKFVMGGLIQAYCTWPYHLSRRLPRTAFISSVPILCSSEVQGVSSFSLVPQIQWIMTRLLRWRCSSPGLFGPHVLLPGS